MRKGTVWYIALFILLILPATSFAARGGYRYRAPGPAPYLGVFLGVSVPDDADVTGNDFLRGSAINETLEFDPGVNVGVTGGFDFGMARLEAELSYKHAEMSTVRGPGGVTFNNVDGRAGALAFLFNGFVDVHNTSPVTPYFGGGVGFAAVHVSDTYGTRSGTGASTLLYISDDDTVFAYQIGAGVNIFLTPLVSLDVGYRYFGTSTAEFTGTEIQPEFELNSHNVSVGVRFTF